MLGVHVLKKIYRELLKNATTGWLAEIDETRKDVTAGRTAHVLNVQHLAHVLLIGDQL